MERYEARHKPTVLAFLQSRTSAALPTPLLHALSERSPPVFWVEERGQCVSFLSLWFENLGPEPSAQISYWIHQPMDVAVARWTESNLLEKVLALAKERGAHVVRVRVPFEDEGRQGALAVQGFEQVDELMVMQMAVPRVMMPLHIKLGVVWTLQFTQTDMATVAPMHNEAYEDDYDVVKLTKDSLKALSGEPSEVWVAHVGDKQIGFLELAKGPNGVGHIASIGVMKAFREQGMGTELVLWGLEQFSKRGVRTAQLSVRGSNTAAIRIYRKIGFVPTSKMAVWQNRIVPLPVPVPPVLPQP